jgi:PAS domain S-box-containing protein
MPLVAEPGSPEHVTAPPSARAWPLSIRSSLQLLVLVTLLPLAGLVAWLWIDGAPGSPRLLMTLTALAALALAWLLASAIARSIEQPLNSIAAVTQAVAEGDSSVRVDADGALEIESVGRQINQMLDLRSGVEAALRTSEERLERALDASGLSLWDYDVAAGTVWLSDSWSVRMGGPRKAMLSRFDTLAARVPPEERPAMQSALARALKDSSATVYSIEHRVLRDDGSWFWNLSEGRVVERDANGRALRMLGSNRDISERKAAQSALEASQDRYRAIVENALDAVVQMDARGLIVGWNRRAAALFGWPAAQAIGRVLHETIMPLRHREPHRRGLERVVAGGAPRMLERRIEIEALHRDGHEFPVELSVTALPSRGELEFTAILRDISARQRADEERSSLEAQLRESQKMEAIGTLAGGIAHDFNNIVGAILGNLALAREQLATDHRALDSLDQAQRAARRGRSLVQQILAFSRRQPQQLTRCLLRPVVEETLALMRAALPAGVALEPHLADEPLQVHADATQLQQVLMNLCTNAWQALPGDRGRIDVGLEREAPDEAGIDAVSCALLWVSDDGRGMDAATRARIFEPFFTTKLPGKGTGLGLAVVHGIVAAHGGSIRVDSEPGRGSRFEVRLPLLQPGALLPLHDAAPSGFGSEPVLRVESARVLAIDDDEVMLLLIERLLQRAGYQATVMRDPRQALAVLEADADAFAVVLSDYNMPAMSGLDVARAVTRLRPGLPVIVSSGLIDAALVALARDAGVSELLHKESLHSELGPALARALRGAG